MWNKYHARKTRYGDHLYDSKLEAHQAWELDMRKRAGEIEEWERQVREELRGENGGKVCAIVVDFKVTNKNGEIEFIEVKSPATKTATWRLKWKLLEDKLKNENVKLTVVE